MRAFVLFFNPDPGHMVSVTRSCDQGGANNADGQESQKLVKASSATAVQREIKNLRLHLPTQPANGSRASRGSLTGRRGRYYANW